MPALALDRTNGHTKVAAASTPMIAQFLEIKARHPDFLLFYRMGDFFELFFDDAVQAAAALGIQLTKRGKHEGQDIPMCGVPVVRAGDYLQKLIRQGFRVAVAEQLEDPEDARRRGTKSVVRRDIVRLVTAGTLTEDALLSPSLANYLTAAAYDKRTGTWSFASLDISTGEFLLSEVPEDEAGGELARLCPAEILIAEKTEGRTRLGRLAPCGTAFTALPETAFTFEKGERALKEAFGVAALDGIGQFTRLELRATGALLHYVDLTQMGERPILRIPKRDTDAAYLSIDAATRASLELVRPTGGGATTLFSTIDRTVTAAGRRELMSRLLTPSGDPDIINRRLDAVALLVGDEALRCRLRTALKCVPDMARALSRLKLKRGGPRDLAALRDGLIAAQNMEALLAPASLPSRALTDIRAKFRDPNLMNEQGLAAALKAALQERPPLAARDGGAIATGFDAALDGLRRLAADTKAVIAELQACYADSTGIKALKIQYNSVFGYFIEVNPVSANHLRDAPHSAVFRHKQTLANAVRFTTEELDSLELRVLAAASDALALEEAHCHALAAAVLHEERAICHVAEALAELDCIAGLADLAHSQNYVRPDVDNSRCFTIEHGRHPCVEQALSKTGSTFIANSCALDGSGEEAPALLLVTGPNMAGKSTFLRQNALICVLAHMGSFVPAAAAHIGVADRLFARIGSADDLSRGRSTFMVEMAETASILNLATVRSLVILDEIGRGTSTFDGLSIAWAVLEHLHGITKCRALVATHYHELTQLAQTLPRVENVRMSVKEWKDSIVFLHTVEQGAAQRSYGIQAAKLAGVPKPVLDRARQLLIQLEKDSRQPSLPLFDTAAREAHATSAPDPAIVKLLTLDLDALSPREALAELYALQALAAE